MIKTGKRALKIVSLVAMTIAVKTQACDSSIYSQQALDKGLLQTIIHLNPFLKPIKEHIKQEQYIVQQNPMRNFIAEVRESGDPCPEQERAWRKQRFARVKKAQEHFLGMTLADDEVLEIGLSLSGGGFRAMLGALGSCCAADAIGLLDCCMTVAGLSGATWFLGPWITSGMSVHDFKKQLLPKLEHGLEPDELLDFKVIIDRLLVKFAYEQPLSTVDLYGAFLANTLFSMCHDQSQNACLYVGFNKKAVSQAQRIARGTYPFPVYTAVLGDANMGQEWFECTPYEVGCRAFEAFVPSWGFGRSFNAGKSVDDAPEQSLGFILGTCGSAFGFNLQQAYDIFIEKNIDIPVLQDIFYSLFNSPFGQFRFCYAEINNFMYNMPDKPMNDYRLLKLVDAGLDFMNPIFATYRKEPAGTAPDMVIVCDYSESGLGEFELERAAAYAHRKGLAFPCVDSPHAGTKTCTIFEGAQESNEPTIVYMPRIKDQELLATYRNHKELAYYSALLSCVDWEHEVADGFASTLNMYYTKKEAEVASAVTEFNMLANADTIRGAMRQRVLEKRAVRA